MEYKVQERLNWKRIKRGEDEEDIVEVSFNDKVDVISVGSGIGVYVCALVVNNYRQEEFFLKIDLIKEPDIPLRDVCLSKVTSFRGPFCMYGFINFCSTLSDVSARGERRGCDYAFYHRHNGWKSGFN